MAYSRVNIMKACTRCKETKLFEYFTKDKNAKDGFAIYCKPCRSAMRKEAYPRYRDKAVAKSKEYREAHPEKVASAKKRCYEAKKDEYADKSKKRYIQNKKGILARCCKYRAANRDRIRARDRAYKKSNREVLNKKQLEYQKREAERLNEYSREYVKKRRKTDKLYALKINMRGRFKFELAKRGETKWLKANEYLGCSWVELRDYLEAQFTDDMSWNNYGEWHVDHIVPLATAENKEQLVELCHYTNLRPLWAFDNISKGAKLPDNIPEHLKHIVEQKIA